MEQQNFFTAPQPMQPLAARLRPLLRLLLKVVNFCTLGLLYVAVDAWLVWTAAALVENSVQFQNFWWALAVAAVVNAARMAIDALSGDVRR